MAISDIALKQAIPPRFLENILNEMRQGGFVESRRGVQGGYLLSVNPAELTVGRVIRFIDGSFDPVNCTGPRNKPCPLKGRCSLDELWQSAKVAVEEVYDSATFQHLVEREIEIGSAQPVDFCI